MIAEGWQTAAVSLAWGVAVVWCLRTRALINGVAEIPDLSRVEWDLCPVSAPGLIVVVPARNEAEALPQAMDTLLAQDYPWLRIVAVDDRSTDATGYLLEEFAAAYGGRLDVIHLTETAEGWLGKTFALEAGTQTSNSDYVLFTAADVWLSPSILRRALAFAQITGADHVVVAPTPVVRSWGERTLESFLQVASLWVSRPWRVADPGARWDVAGESAFNLLRRDALDELGGWLPQRLAVVDDLTLGRRVRAAGLRQRLVYAPGLVLTHRAPGAWNIVRSLTRTSFASVNFSVWLQLPVMFLFALLFLLPLIGLGWLKTVLPSLIALSCLTVCYRLTGEIDGIPARYGWLYPLGALATLWAMLRSVLVTGWRRGVLWSGTLYPLRELRPYNSPFVWQRQASRERDKRRDEMRKAERIARPSPLLRWVQQLRRVPRPWRRRTTAR